MTTKKEGPGSGPSNSDNTAMNCFKNNSITGTERVEDLPRWVIDDLNKSGLTIETFPVELITSERELVERLGFSSLNGTRISDIGGFWIPYPGVSGFHRLKLREPIGDVKYLSPKGGGNHPYFPPGVREALSKYTPDKPIFLTEGEKKSSKATLKGFPCIGLSGVWCWKDSENDFLTELDSLVWKDRQVYICFDSDVVEKHNVRHAELSLTIELLNHGAHVSIIRLPSEPNGNKNGLDDYLVHHGSESFEILVKEAKPALELHVEEGTDTRLILKELHRLDNEILRAKTLKALARREGVNTEAVEDEYRKYTPERDEGEKKEVETFTEEEIAQAKELLNSPDILAHMLSLTKKIGFVGETINQKLLFLCFTSRLTDDSISAVIKGQTSTGKSHLVNTILRLFPTADVLNFSYITSKALVHREGDLSHKILSIAEHTGSESSDYSVRTLLSEREISIMTPIKNEATGNFETIEKRIPAKGLVFVETTTRDRIHAENQTRVLDLYVSDSKLQTGKILAIQARQLESESPETEREIKIWCCAQTLLKNLPVYVPYARELAVVFPKDKVRARRDFPRLLSLIKTHALLHQYRRGSDEKGRLVATIEDFESVIPLAEAVLAQSLKEISPKQEKVLEVIKSKFSNTDFSPKELNTETKKIVGYRTILRYLEGFVKDGIVEWNGEKAKASRYTLIGPLSQMSQLGLSAPNFIESLKNTYPQLCQKDLSQYVTNVTDGDNCDITDIDDKNDLSQLNRKNGKDEHELNRWSMNCDITDTDIEGGMHPTNGVGRLFRERVDEDGQTEYLSTDEDDGDGTTAELSDLDMEITLKKRMRRVGEYINGPEEKLGHAEGCDCEQCTPEAEMSFNEGEQMSDEQMQEWKDELLDQHNVEIDRDFGPDVIRWLDTEPAQDLTLLIADSEDQVTRVYNEGSVAELKALLKEHRELYEEAQRRIINEIGDCQDVTSRPE